MFHDLKSTFTLRGATVAGLLLLGTGLSAQEHQSYLTATDLTSTDMEYVISDDSSETLATHESVVSFDNLDSMNNAEAKPVVCDEKKKKELAKAVAGAYKGVYFDNNFNYLCDPCYNDWHLGENMKRICVGNCGVFDLGGEYRARYHNENNFRGLGPTGRDDNFLLQRLRVYGNYEINDWSRVYAEMLHATSEFEDFNPRPIEENYWNLQNCFADIKFLDTAEGEYWVRYGRQELLYGAQRTVSPLDWANTRRTFEGIKVFYKGTDWDVDAFATRPIYPTRDTFDSPNYDQAFYGVYTTHKANEKHKQEYYWLGFENDVRDFNYQTLGSRLYGNLGCEGELLYEAEAAYQFGHFMDDNHNAGFFTLGLGHEFDHCWKPTLWAYYDWASGDQVIGNGYDHLFPLAHKYLGFMDIFGRRNITDVNFLLTAKPDPKHQLLMWYHIFHRQNDEDAAYSVVMTPLGNNPANPFVAGSKYLGQELDFMWQYNISAHSDVILGYSHFFTGSFFTNPANPDFPYKGDASFFWAQYSLRF
ncbi:alginate export family protein [Blastopirellula sp. JC732]|uniref:Alginate export family protein n=1 Tax=Blastopirellula sediminis TaxID=2894196 RepID=A0A9X1SDU1_9BACT|nr:alginate export family protein [Blastopirellula sediminis]MCC9608167.1 alginate export family protein [Blastopirellula sediminis]MCC9627040.1 alginate export family protein [Blastopirellula sediminis]